MFTSKQALKLTGVSSYPTLDYWVRSGFITPANPASGRGSSRSFSFRDVVALRVAVQLRAAGVSLQALRAVVERLRDWKGLDSATDALASVRLVVAGADVLLVASDAELVSALRTPGQSVAHVVALSDVVQSLREEAARDAA